MPYLATELHARTYDGRRAMTGLADASGGLSTWTFDALGQNTQQVLPDGSVATLAYDAASRLTGIRHKDGAGALLDQAQLGYDAVGNPLAKTTQDGLHAMTYDAENQLLSESHPLAGVKTWTFDPAGNRLSQDHAQVGVRTLTNWAYDPADQITMETTGTAVTTYTFDGAGNEQVVEAPAGRTTNTWDSDNRLLGYVLPSGVRNTMSYRPADGLRHRLVDSEGDKLMAWDSQGPTGYVDLLEENLS